MTRPELFIKSLRHDMRGKYLEVMEHKINPIGGYDSSDDRYYLVVVSVRKTG